MANISREGSGKGIIRRGIIRLNVAKAIYMPPARRIMFRCEFAKASARGLRHERRS